MEAKHLEQTTMKLAELRIPEEQLVPRAPIPKRVRGYEYEVVWDGA